MPAEIRAQIQPWSPNIAIRIWDSDMQAAAKRITLEPVEEGEEIQPSFTIKPNEAQQLMDDLWRCGFRPTDGQGTAGQLEATRRHLEDMRTLVFREKTDGNKG